MPKKIEGQTKDLGGFSVKRILPQAGQRMVGPFVFLDHMGPAHFKAGDGINVRPHPHIGLATVSYLLKGSMLHRDSLGSIQEIFPGDVNWMTAGKGIVHSERETIEVRASDHELDGLQCWMALPKGKTEIDPSFFHIPKCQLPYIHKEKLLMRLIAGEAFGKTSPVKTYSPMFYLDVTGEQGALVERPFADHEVAVYVQMGSIEISGERFEKGDFIVFEEQDQVISLCENSRFLMLGGEPFEEQPFMHWNFVAYDKERIEKARDDWQNGRFPSIPGDDEEWIPLPE